MARCRQTRLLSYRVAVALSHVPTFELPVIRRESDLASPHRERYRIVATTIR
jgi:hypothetical protein